jgi:hypothetical protein
MFLRRIIEVTQLNNLVSSRAGTTTPVGIMIDQIKTIEGNGDGCKILLIDDSFILTSESLKSVAVKINGRTDLSIYLSNNTIDVNAAVHER